MEYYSAIKILPLTATWMDLEGIMLSETRQRKTSVRYHWHVESKKYNKLVNMTKKKQARACREQTRDNQWWGKGYQDKNKGGPIRGTNY